MTHLIRRRELMLLLGGAMSMSHVLRAQQKAIPVIGFLGSASPGSFAARAAAFRQGLSEGGYVEGQNVAIEYRWAEGRFDRLPAMAADLVARKVDVIATTGGDSSAFAGPIHLLKRSGRSRAKGSTHRHAECYWSVARAHAAAPAKQ